MFSFNYPCIGHNLTFNLSYFPFLCQYHSLVFGIKLETTNDWRLQSLFGLSGKCATTWWIYILVLFVRPVQDFMFYLPADPGVLITRNCPGSPAYYWSFWPKQIFYGSSREAEITQKNTLPCSQCGCRLFFSSELLKTPSWCVLHPQQRRDQIRPFHKCGLFPGSVQLWISQ